MATAIFSPSSPRRSQVRHRHGSPASQIRLCLELTYDVPPSWNKGCLNSASNKWRQFKSHLTQTFISNKLDKPEELDEQPSGYVLARDDWISFVMTCMSDDFIANELCDDDEINRAIIWKKGRVNKEGKFDGQELKKTIDKIDDYIQQKRERTLEINGTKEDILTKALNSREHGGRVRVVGGHITPTLFFNVSRWKTDDLNREIMIEQKRELVEARKLIQEQDTRIQKLEAIVYKKGAWSSDIDDKGSCSVKLPQQNDNKLKTDKTFPSYEEFNDVEMQVVDKEVALQGKSVILTLDSSTDIVAYGTVVEVNGVHHFLHGVPLPKNCMCVSIDEAMQKSARLPVPIPNECETIGEAVGTHVAWPKHLLML
ncbi:uncharacterized protein LOC122017137 isoform X2 [Zingiber officinale]|uniref:uncharacterized protein LOC122017137 isoform X2 n=1 Tax=Zingiber officinale TaxID=94328 RepID=UPI001C4C9CC3|nr:uncharacterized protein LOC122017137 isoform X2 [Zingiber officinale]